MFVEAGASAIFLQKISSTKLRRPAPGLWGSPGHGELLLGSCSPYTPQHPGVHRRVEGRNEGNAGWHHLAISFSSLFFPTGCSWSCIFEVCCCQVVQKSSSQAVPAPSTHALPSAGSIHISHFPSVCRRQARSQRPFSALPQLESFLPSFPTCRTQPHELGQSRTQAATGTPLYCLSCPVLQGDGELLIPGWLLAMPGQCPRTFVVLCFRKRHPAPL